MTNTQYTIRSLQDDISRFNSELESAGIQIKLMIDSHYGEHRIIEVDTSGEQQVIKGERCRGKARACYEELVVWKNNLIKDAHIEIACKSLRMIMEKCSGRPTDLTIFDLCYCEARRSLEKMGFPYE